MIEVLFTEDDEQIQTLVFERFTPACDKNILIWRLWRRWLHSTTYVLKRLIEFSNVHSIEITDKVFNFQISLTSLLDKNMSFANHPFGIRFEAAWRADHTSSSDVNESQDKRLPQASRCPDHLAEEVDLPKRIDMGLEELIPCTRPAPKLNLASEVRG